MFLSYPGDSTAQMLAKPNAPLSEGSPPAAPVLDAESALSVLHGDTLKLMALLVTGLVLGDDLQKVLY